ncbi:MAG: glycosyltransferase [Desulfobacterales bacterium]|nr:glycosyltransferase [Desulfobacterales bacterium]
MVDSFSTDGTLEIVRRYTDRILQHEYLNSAAQKNWTIPQALHDWVLIVDSDERVTPELKKEITALLMQRPQKDGYWIRRKELSLRQRDQVFGLGNRQRAPPVPQGHRTLSGEGYMQRSIS